MGSNERILPAIIFVTVISATFLLLVGFMGTMIATHDRSTAEGPGSGHSSIFEDVLNATYTTGTPANWTPDGTLLYGDNGGADSDGWDDQVFTGFDRDIHVYVFRNLSSVVFYWADILNGHYWAGKTADPNNVDMLKMLGQIRKAGSSPSDFILVYQSYKGGTLDLQTKFAWKSVNFGAIENGADPKEGDPSKLIFEQDMVLHNPCAIYVGWDKYSGSSYINESANLWANHFEIAVASDSSASYDVNPWTLIKSLATFQGFAGLPNWMSVLIGVMFWCTIVFIIIEIWARAIKPTWL